MEGCSTDPVNRLAEGLCTVRLAGPHNQPNQSSPTIQAPQNQVRPPSNQARTGAEWAEPSSSRPPFSQHFPSHNPSAEPSPMYRYGSLIHACATESPSSLGALNLICCLMFVKIVMGFLFATRNHRERPLPTITSGNLSVQYNITQYHFV